MGGKRSGKRKHIHLSIAILILLSTLACAFDQAMNTRMVDSSGEEAQAHLILGRRYFAEGNFASALEENEKVLFLAGRNTPIDEALFSIALIHAQFDNLARDYGKSLITLKKLINDYPGSPLAQQAKVIVGLIQNNERLNRQVERLNKMIDALQKADTSSEAKTAEQAKRTEQAKTAEQAKTITALTQENEKLSLTVERLNTIIDELKRVDIDVDQKKREKVK
jgi:tetratricopeptide (TPR) repeat protein